MPQPNESQLHANGVDLALFEWPGDGPAVFFAHATGFHARCWDQVIAQLPGIRCLALDMRGHGRSEKPEPPYAWRDFGRDVADVCRQIGLEGAIGVGHSKGGYAVTMAAGIEPGIFSQLLLVDPVIMQPENYGRIMAGEHFAAKRRNEWSSVAEMEQRFAGREPFSRWDPAVLHDYVEYGLLPNPAGEGYVLACPPRIEAAVYAASGGESIYDAIAAVHIPVRILRARQRTADDIVTDMGGSPTWKDLHTKFADAEDVYLPKYSHFMPMEDPVFIAAQVRELRDRIAARA
jgi:lipase